MEQQGHILLNDRTISQLLTVFFLFGLFLKSIMHILTYPLRSLIWMFVFQVKSYSETVKSALDRVIFSFGLDGKSEFRECFLFFVFF